MKKTHRAGFGVTCILAGILACTGAVVSLYAQQPKQSSVIRVQTNLVSILASVLDAHGQPIPDLTQDVFELSEEGVPQKIERFEAETNRPLDLALMVDSSMSTYKDMKFEAEAAAHFVRQVVRPGDTLSVFEFDEKVTQLSEYSADVPKLQEAVRRISSGSGTSIYDAIVLGANSLRRRPGDRRRAIVMVTDAGETTSISKFEDARRAAIASEALLYSIVLRPANESGRNTAGEHALITITDSTGGTMFLVDEMQQLDATFDRIDRELRTQYLLGYYPTPVPPPGSHRRVSVTVKTGDIVRYRKEYFTAGAPR
ncbi:MAG TPA: VWA domain-containing protein [Candidatus Acidoferrales bacterium]|jgi:Ca-activated chloride channel homolog|nr:VWA domain-containing protein [Candidatus Acidoferrales bacterium]